MISTNKQNPTEIKGVLRVMNAPQVIRPGEPVAKIPIYTTLKHNKTQPQYDLKFSASNINTTFTTPSTQVVTAEQSVYLQKPPFSFSGVRNTL